MAICSYLTGDNSVGSGWCITAPACFDLKTSHSCLAFSTRQKKMFKHCGNLWSTKTQCSHTLRGKI